MKTIFCSTCKRHVQINKPNRKEALQEFHKSGHTEEKVARLQRDPGRRQRPDKWRRG